MRLWADVNVPTGRCIIWLWVNELNTETHNDSHLNNRKQSYNTIKNFYCAKILGKSKLSMQRTKTKGSGNV